MTEQLLTTLLSVIIFAAGVGFGVAISRRSQLPAVSTAPAPASQQPAEIDRIRIEQENGSVDPGPFRIQIGTKELEVRLTDVVGTSIQVRDGTGYLHLVPIAAVKPECLPQVLAAVNAHPGRNQVLEFEDGQRLASAIRYGNPPQV